MKILIPTDGSEFSDAAVRKACELITKPSETEIKVISVYEPPAPTALGPFIASPDYQHVVIDTLKELAGGYVERARAAIERSVPNINVTTAVAMGTPAQYIVERAEEWNSDLIVVGSHGRGFWGRALVGSVSDAVLNHAPCSVLVVRKPRSSGDQTPEGEGRLRGNDN